MATGTIPMVQDVLLASQYNLTNVVILDTVSIATNATKTGTYNISKSGYTPYSITGYRVYNSDNGGVGCSHIHISKLQLSGNTVTYSVYNTMGSTAVITFYIQVLYFKV